MNDIENENNDITTIIQATQQQPAAAGVVLGVVDMTGEISGTTTRSTSTTTTTTQLDMIEEGNGRILLRNNNHNNNKNSVDSANCEENNKIVVVVEESGEEEEEEELPGEDVAMLLEQPLATGAGGDVDNNNINRKNSNDNDESLSIETTAISTTSSSSSLNESMYSIIYIANPKTQAFYFGILIFLIQASLLTLALINLIDLQSSNPLDIPAGVDKSVHAAGYFALLLSIPYFPDLLDSIETFHEGYHPIVLKQTPYATKSKWFLAATLQLLFGLLFQFVIFLLIVQSTDVIGMFLNFAALGFITEVDDVAYKLIDRGYFSIDMKLVCEQVKKSQYKFPNATTKGPWLRRLALLFFVLVVMVAYSIIFAMQDRGDYSCTRLEVQFGDNDYSTSSLPLYSGLYYVDKATKWRRKDSRLVYVDEQSNGQSAAFRYCHNNKAWVFGLFENNNNHTNSREGGIHEDDIEGICKEGKWILNSPSTKSYDLSGERAMDWMTQKDNTQQTSTSSSSSSSSSSLSHPVDHLILSCFECSKQTCNVMGGTCEKDSVTGHDYCICKEGFIGNRCQYNIEEACDYVDYDHRYDPFPDPIPSRFDLAKHSDGSLYEFRGKAVYAHVLDDEEDKNDTENNNMHNGLFLLVFMGRRYHLLFDVYGNITSRGNGSGRFENATSDTIVDDYLEFMNTERRQHGTNSNYLPLYISEPLDVGTSNDKLIPTDLGWYVPTKNSRGEPVSVGAAVTTRLLCGTCNHNVGLYCEISGQCNSDTGRGECVCNEGIIMDGDGAVGPLCELYVSNITRWHEEDQIIS